MTLVAALADADEDVLEVDLPAARFGPVRGVCHLDVASDIAGSLDGRDEVAVRALQVVKIQLQADAPAKGSNEVEGGAQVGETSVQRRRA